MVKIRSSIVVLTGAAAVLSLGGVILFYSSKTPSARHFSPVPVATAAAITRCELVAAPARVAAMGTAIPAQIGSVRNLDTPARIAAWAPDDSLLITLAEPFSSTERVALLAPETGMVRELTTRVSAPHLPKLAHTNDRRETVLLAVESPNVAAINLLPALNPAHGYVNGAIQTRVRPHGPERLIFHSGGAVLFGGAMAPCVWRFNHDEDGAQLPLLDAIWSSDGRYLAALVQSDAMRLGSTHVRVIDTESGTLPAFDIGVAPAGSIVWRPNSTQLLLTIADQPESSSYETLHLFDLRTATLAPLTQTGAFFAPSYWGAQFSPDGTRLAVACAAPELDQPLARGRVCVFDLPTLKP